MLRAFRYLRQWLQNNAKKRPNTGFMMSDLPHANPLLQHLAANLSQLGLVGYVWHVEEDRFEWAGDLHGLFGLDGADRPQTNPQFNCLLNPQDAPQRLAALHDFLKAAPAAPFIAHYKLRHANGQSIQIEESARLQQDGPGRTLLCGFIKRVATAAETIALPAADNTHIPLFDGGSAHYGRRSLQQKIEQWAHSNSARAQSAGYLLVLGIDRLSLMNEAFGARYVDEIIEKTGARLRQLTGTTGQISRIDGDVFGIFFDQALGSEMPSVARHLLGNFFENPIMTNRGPVAVSISVGGIAFTPLLCRDAASVITKAEMAMRTAKERGRGCFVSYQEAADQAVDTRMLIESGDEFLRALKGNRVRLAFQPVIAAGSEVVSFHECLIRMIGLDGKLISAAQFIPAIEKLGLSRLVDKYAMHTAIQELAQFPTLSLSVNVSNMTLTNPDWLRGVVSSLRDRPSIARRLIIEITESAVVRDMAQAARVTQTLKDLGCRIALDDFGTGYTAFSQIKDMHVDIVKIDKSFVRNIDDAQNRLFVRTLQSLAKGVNIETVGEGAETLADARSLTHDGVNYIQGYVYGFPRVERVWLPKEHAFRAISLLDENRAPGSLITDAYTGNTAGAAQLVKI